MKQVVIIASLFLWACGPKKGNEPGVSAHKAERNSDIDSSGKTDSLKWLYYATNHQGKILFMDSVTNKLVEADPAGCEVRLEKYVQVNKDSAFYFFSFTKEQLIFRNVNNGIYTYGMGVFNGQVYPLTAHVVFDFTKNPDSTKAYFRETDSSFSAYLRNYVGFISPWLKQEARRRKIL